jgi:hypothetical protein
MPNTHRLLSIVAAASLTAATAFAQNAAPPAAPARETPRPQDLEPGVDTSSPAQSPDNASSKPAASSASSKPASPATRSTASGGKPQGAAGVGAAPDTGAAIAASPATGAIPASAGANTPSGQAAAAKPGAKGKSLDRLELDTTQITGNRELPKVLYIVPWKRSDLGDLVGRPVNSLLDEVLTPVDRDVFQRENRYYRALTPGAAENDALSAPDSRGATPVRSPTPTNSAPAAGSQGSATRPANSTGSPIGSTGSGSAASPPRDEK